MSSSASRGGLRPTARIIGASSKPGSDGRAVAGNLTGFFGRTRFIDLNRVEVCGSRAYPDARADFAWTPASDFSARTATPATGPWVRT